jgi:hypothetical protein
MHGTCPSGHVPCAGDACARSRAARGVRVRARGAPGLPRGEDSLRLLAAAHGHPDVCPLPSATTSARSTCTRSSRRSCCALAYREMLIARCHVERVVQECAKGTIKFAIWGSGEELHGVAEALALCRAGQPRGVRDLRPLPVGRAAGMWAGLRGYDGLPPRPHAPAAVPDHRPVDRRAADDRALQRHAPQHACRCRARWACSSASRSATPRGMRRAGSRTAWSSRSSATARAPRATCTRA